MAVRHRSAPAADDEFIAITISDFTVAVHALPCNQSRKHFTVRNRVQQIPPAGERKNNQPAPIYKFLVFKIERHGEGEILGELILTTEDFTHALTEAAKQQG